MQVNNITSFSYANNENKYKNTSKHKNFGLRIIDAKFVKGKNETADFIKKLYEHHTFAYERQKFLAFMMAIKGFLGDTAALKGKKELFGSGMKIYYAENGKKLMTLTTNGSCGANQMGNLYKALKNNQGLTDESLEIFAKDYVFRGEEKGLNTTKLFSRIYENAPHSDKQGILTNVLALQEMCNPNKQLILVGTEMGSGKTQLLLNDEPLMFLNNNSSINELSALVKKVKDKLGIVQDTEAIAAEKLLRPDLRE